MQIQILGSGGFMPIPRATCQCRICKQARLTGWPATRHSPALYLPEIETLIDTPEDINSSLNFSKINKVKNIFYTHWHPDHTLGYRIVEILQDYDFFKQRPVPINVYIPSYDYDNFKKFIPGLWYFESQGMVKIVKLGASGVTLNKFKIKPIRLEVTTYSAYLVENNRHQAILCPDHSRNFPLRTEFKNADLLICNMGFFPTNLRGLKILPARHRVAKVCTGFEKDNLRIIDALQPKETILMHIEEKYNRTNKELAVLEKKFKQYKIKFAIDGLNIKL